MELDCFVEELLVLEVLGDVHGRDPLGLETELEGVVARRSLHSCISQIKPTESRQLT
jgi:hypothetical protein